MAAARRAPRLLAPEVVQTSAMDCGPAALKCLLEGFGRPVSYGRLREACQTDVDGTSIDTLEDLANDLGLIAEQVIIPIDHALLPGAGVLPAIVVVRQPNGLLHFVVVWRRHGPFVQVMDPATGRRWPRARVFADEIHAHTMPVGASAWREWAESGVFRDGLRVRAARCGVAAGAIDRLIRDASDDRSWRSLATLDAAVRMVAALDQSGAFGRGDAERVLGPLFEKTRDARDPLAVVPADYWTVKPPAPDVPATPGSQDEHVMVTGAVLVRIRGLRAPAEREQRQAELPRELGAALREAPLEPGRHLLTLLKADGMLAPATLLVALLVAAAGVVLEALFFRSLIGLGSHLPLTGHRLVTMATVVCLSAVLLALELPIASAALGLGRRLEARLRIAFLEKIPRLVDRYFQSRPTSDMAERSHATHVIRQLPDLGAQLARSVFELIFTTVGLAVLYPQSAPVALGACLTAVAVSLAAQPWLSERDLRLRTHSGALTRFYLDAFLGLVPIRAHGAERSLAREQEALLTEWARASYALLRTAITASGVQLAVGFGLAAWLLFGRARIGDEGGGALLLAYWALNIPVLGQKIAQVAWQYPRQRNLTLRLLEPLGALEEEAAADSAAADSADYADRADRLDRGATTRRRSPGVGLDFRDVSVLAGGHRILEGAAVAILPGEHVAIVGASGAGKSTFVGLLLGWHRPAAGDVLVDGEPLDAARLNSLRRDTTWIDPAVHLWNRSLLDNLEYGRDDPESAGGGVVSEADLRGLIEQLPEGLQTRLGEGGALVSGGEGQRVRFGRGLGRRRPRLVVLDEPFRGLEREKRADLLRRARRRWRDATLLCVTHDIGETFGFDRVLVVDGGRIVEQGPPSDLAGRPGSRFRSLLDAEAGLRRRLWDDPSWRALRIEAGRIVVRRSGTPEPGDEPERQRVGV